MLGSSMLCIEKLTEEIFYVITGKADQSFERETRNIEIKSTRFWQEMQ